MTRNIGYRKDHRGRCKQLRNPFEDSLMMGRSLDEVVRGPLEASWLAEDMT